MKKIHLLPEDVAQKIAAGEVIERPVSVVKELVENSLDAGASEIRVELVDGGKGLIKVQDNGSGMDREDAALCFRRHSTSKIAKEEDLERIATLGFRGEALASHRRRLPADAADLRRRRRPRHDDRAGRGAPRRRHRHRLSPGHDGRGPGPVLQPAGPAEIPPLGSIRARARGQIRDPGRAGLARGPLHARPRGPRDDLLPAGRDAPRAGLPDLRQKDGRRAHGRCRGGRGGPARGPVVAAPGGARRQVGPVLLRQRPPRQGQDPHGRAESGLYGHPRAGPVAGGLPLPAPALHRRRRQRPSGQGRGPVHRYAARLPARSQGRRGRRRPRAHH